MMNAEEHVLDDLPTYALGSLDRETALVVARHVATCSTCRAELQAFEAVSDQLLEISSAQQPPARVQERLLAQIEAGRASIQAETVTTQRMPRLLLVAVAALGILFIGILAVFSASPVESRPDLHVLALNGTTDAPEVTGVLIVTADGTLGTLVVDHLPPLHSGMKYQMWLRDSEGLVAGQTFGISDSGYWGGHVSSEAPLLSYEWFGVTMEPEDGSPAPTGLVLIEGQIP